MALVKYNNNSLSSVTSASSLPTGAMTLIKSQTASSSSTISFVDGTSDVVLDSTYPIYLFKFINMHPATDNVDFLVNFSADGGSNYNVTKTTTSFRAGNYENDSSTAFAYLDSDDLAQSTGFKNLTENTSMGYDNDQNLGGFLHLYNPSSTTFAKHFIARTNNAHWIDVSTDGYFAGYGNTTSAVNSIQFKMSSGNIDSGQILLFGLN